MVKHRYCFGDNRRTKDNRKIKLCGLKACCVTLISCSIRIRIPGNTYESDNIASSATLTVTYLVFGVIKCH